MTPFEAALLGILQGVTEFLPVSSSGHLKLVEALMGMHHLDQYIIFDLVCHFGTLLAIFFVLYRDLVAALTKDRWLVGMVAIALVPLVPLYFLLHEIKSIYAQPQLLGFFFLTTAAILYYAEYVAAKRALIVEMEPIHNKRMYRDAFFIGIAQAFALLPAISRSGSTIATARFLGWDHARAARFSFLLAVPTILGGTALEILHIFRGKQQVVSLDLSIYLLGGLISFVVGTLVLKVFLKLIAKLSLKPFAYYCALLGILTLILFYFS